VSDEVLDLSEVRSLARRLATIPKEFRGETRKAIRSVGQEMLRDGQRNAAWSSRIPGSMTMRVSFAGRRPGVSVRASLESAPHARVYEGILGDTFRHPLYGRDVWFSQQARPYLLPAVQAANEALVEDITRIVDEIHRKAGLL
jgi:hypothetical protein